MNKYIYILMADQMKKVSKLKKLVKKNPNEVNEKDNDWKRFKKKSELEHILTRPDTFIGSTEIAEPDKSVKYYFLNDNKIESKKDMKFIPGLYKIFDECLVNAADNIVRTRNMEGSEKTSYIKIEIDKNRFAIENDGDAIPVQMHEEEKIWVPEMIFGHMRTSDNYDDTEERLTGGRNGYGAKLAVIFSTKTNIRIIDKKRKKVYTQVFEKNLSIKHVPVIEDSNDEN